MLIPCLAAAIVGGAQSQPVDLYRQFNKGAKESYLVSAHLLTETAEIGVSPIPEELDFIYRFSLNYTGVDEGGFAKVDYRRPTVTEITGETFSSPPIKNEVKVGWHFDLSLSPINEVTDLKDLTKKDSSAEMRALRTAKTLNAYGMPMTTAIQLGGFQQELYRLALFIGSMETALDFSPKLPLEPVVVGETWKKTVSYQPQALKGSKDQAIQRLDLEYKYVGEAMFENKKVHRITAHVKLDTDAGTFINQMMGTTPSQSGLASFPLKIETNIVFDLDLVTKKTLNARAETKGGWSIKVAGVSEAVVTETIKGRASMKPVASK